MSLSSFSKIIIALSLAVPAATSFAPTAFAFGAYGPDTCRQGFVWREAYAGDHTCVRPSERTRTTIDNRQASDRVSATDRTYGDATCRQGYVWRESYVGDTTCVTPAERARVKAENAKAPGRYQ